MKQREMDILTRHYSTYFRQTDCSVLHPAAAGPRIDALLYAPNDVYPYWKLATVGASDFNMPVPTASFGSRNEYMMFIDPRENLTAPNIADWYCRKLMTVAHTPVSTGTFLSCGHSVGWTPEDGDEMVCAYLELPQAIADAGILRCRLGPMKTAVCLQVILLDREENNLLRIKGPEAFSSFLYPKEADGRRHFLCQRHRDGAF